MDNKKRILMSDLEWLRPAFNGNEDASPLVMNVSYNVFGKLTEQGFFSKFAIVSDVEYNIAIQKSSLKSDYYTLASFRSTALRAEGRSLATITQKVEFPDLIFAAGMHDFVFENRCDVNKEAERRIWTMEKIFS